MKSARLLLVDDNAQLLDNLNEILTDAGHRVAVAHTCADALKLATAGFDIAFVDLKLPDGDGTSLVQQLRERSPESEVVLLTGYASVETAADAVRAGAFAYLLKPLAPPQLLLTVEQALRQVELRDEKRQLTVRTHRAEKLAAVGTLTAGLSHEIRNPLNAAGLQLSVLERRLDKLPEATRTPLLQPLRLARDEIKRLEQILQDFLLFARPRELVATPVAIRPLLERVIGLLAPDAERRGIRLSVRADDVKVAGDEGQLQQVLMNLALNALEALENRGQIELLARAVGTQVEICVDDDGPGVPEELRERILEPFFTTKAQGSGLGLAIVHALMAQHRGTLKLEKSPLGGARFLLLLPAAP